MTDSIDPNADSGVRWHTTRLNFLNAGRYRDVSAWKEDFYREYYELLAVAIPDNIDRFRFAERKDSQFLTSWHHGEFAALSANFDAAFVTRGLFADDASRTLFDLLLLFRLLGQTHVSLPLYPRFKALETKTLEALGVSSHRDIGSPMALTDVDVNSFDRSFHVRCLPINILQTFFVHQYYVDRPSLSIAPKPGDHVVDAGACFGDTALLFAHSVGDAGRVYAFEMVPEHLRIIARNAEKNPDLARRITVFAAALGDEAVEAVGVAEEAARHDAPVNPGARYDTALSPCWRLDDVVDKGLVKRVDFLKLDVEGDEPKVLRGAARTIANYRPVLAISVYHSLIDLIYIPQMVAALDLDYELHLEHYTIHAEETILFAIPRAGGCGAETPAHAVGTRQPNTTGTGDGGGPDTPDGLETATAAYWRACQEQTRLELIAVRNDIDRREAYSLEQARNWREAYDNMSREADALRAHAALLQEKVTENGRRVPELEAEVARIAQEAALKTVAHTTAMREVSSFKTVAEVLEQEIAAFRDEVRAYAEAASGLEERIRRIEAERDEAILQLQAILRSTTWRGTAFVRERIAARPRMARHAHRAAKLLWWTASGQLLSRLRARRAALSLAQQGGASVIPEPPMALRSAEPSAVTVAAIAGPQGVEPWSDALPMVSAILSEEITEAKRDELLSQLSRTVPRHEILVIAQPEDILGTGLLPNLAHPSVRRCVRPASIGDDADGDFALQRAFGKYVCFLRPGDRLPDDYPAGAIDQLERSGAEYAVCRTSSPLIIPDSNEFALPPIYRRSTLARWSRDSHFGSNDARRTSFATTLMQACRSNHERGPVTGDST